ncbi:hypothetical protein Pla108_40550 [Botrimarina colliarenosi]|uniref:Glutaminase A n=1 Tax=Botrimarina colliarenosi TaxID=2528001 RepID=A0A5C6A0I7_9BACT|nr:DUF4965 domain-containing protein [Botrimarina colliarenosi]TWT92915.1 hypothetical protein Pla108_40550 [Botrimarina colliarenosi]
MTYPVLKSLTAWLILASINLASVNRVASANEQNFLGWTPPATPLVTCDPYFSVWSTGRQLTEVETTHWTGRRHAIGSVVTIDGQTYRVLGAEPEETPALEQIGLRVAPTRTVYVFRGAGVELELAFTTPMLPDDLDLMSRPVTYVDYEMKSIDGESHDVAVAFNVSGELCVNLAPDLVKASAVKIKGGRALKMGSVSQAVLMHQGDDIRIDWGHLYLAAAGGKGVKFSLAEGAQQVTALRNGASSDSAPTSIESAPGNEVAGAVTFQGLKVGDKPVTRGVVLAYDDLYSITYMGSRLRPYLRRDGLTAKGLLSEALADHRSVIERCEAFDQELIADLEAAGGREYADIACLAYRECFAAGKLVADANGLPIQFCKENNSNGCIGTSDVFYPMAPQFLLFGPSLAKSFIVPFMEYAASDRWTFPFAPHDLGTYPRANGQVYGGGEHSEENQMPVEESGNLLILMAAIAKLDGDASFAERYWPQLTEWAEYLEQSGFDPANQLCTDDFAGHLAHNVNLSAKAICVLGAFAQLCEIRGDEAMAAKYRATAKEFAARWIEAADDGNHFRLAFDKPDTWSQKYNLVWDRLLGLDLFPDAVREKEMHFYRRMQNRFGLPLDNRRPYTKLDWILWTATLTGDREDFEALVQPVHRFLRETPNKVPMTDWYRTHSGERVGFTARPVVGGVFMRLLYEPQVWDKWARRGGEAGRDYAQMPVPPEIDFLVKAADEAPAVWRYTTQAPQGDWQAGDYDDSQWSEGESGFGTSQTPNSTVGTKWTGSDIWLRRQFDLPGEINESLRLHIHHDEKAQVFLNGVLAGEFKGYTTQYDQQPIRPDAIAALKSTGNVLAVHCRQTSGGQYIDVGISALKKATLPVQR